MEAIENDYEITPLGANPTIAKIKSHKEKKKKRKLKPKQAYFMSSHLHSYWIIQLESPAKIWKYLKIEYQGNKRVKHM